MACSMTCYRPRRHAAKACRTGTSARGAGDASIDAPSRIASRAPATGREQQKQHSHFQSTSLHKTSFHSQAEEQHPTNLARSQFLSTHRGVRGQPLSSASRAQPNTSVYRTVWPISCEPAAVTDLSMRLRCPCGGIGWCNAMLDAAVPAMFPPSVIVALRSCDTASNRRTDHTSSPGHRNRRHRCTDPPMCGSSSRRPDRRASQPCCTAKPVSVSNSRAFHNRCQRDSSREHSCCPNRRHRRLHGTRRFGHSDNHYRRCTCHRSTSSPLGRGCWCIVR